MSAPRFREGWLQRTLEHARIELEESEKARIRARKRCREWDSKHPLGKEIQPAPEWAID